MAVLFIIWNLFVCVGSFWLYKYLYSGTKKVKAVSRNDLVKEFALGFLDAMREQHESGRK